MPQQFIRETVELSDFTTDPDGNAYIQKRINLRSGFAHRLLQTDLFEDTIPFIRGGPADRPNIEIIISPYPQIPTRMNYQENPPVYTNRYASAGTDTVLFKANGDLVENTHTVFRQFPSPQIAAAQKDVFYSNHVYISVHFMGLASTDYGNLSLSFLMVLDNVKTSILTATMGQMQENHDAMVAELMSNGHIISRADLLGNVFPMWRYGGIRPELTLSPFAAGSFFLQLPSRDEELMQTTAQIRVSVADARSMGAYDATFGDRFPDWCRFGLNEGLVSGPVRDQWPPIKHADNGNVLCL